MKILFKNQGQSLIEVIIAMAIFGLVAAALMGFVLNGDQALRQGGEQAQAEALAQEGMEAVKSIRDNAWNNLTMSSSKILASTSQWIFGNEGDSEQVGKYTRSISFADVCRYNTTGQIAGQKIPSLSSGNIANSNFNNDTSSWISGTWGDTVATCNYDSSKANHNINVVFPSKKSSESYGYWQQAFTITDDRLASMTVSLKWLEYSSICVTPDLMKVYVYIDRASGTPQNLNSPLWSSDVLCSTNLNPLWFTLNNYDVLNTFTGPGTYYLKLVAYVKYPSGAFDLPGSYAIGFDDVYLNWQSYHKDLSYCPDGSYEDAQSKIATVNVSWPVRDGVTNSVEKTSILTNWHSRDWTQTDWSDGSGQDNWSNPRKYDSNYDIKDDVPNQISLTPLSGFGTTTWPFDVFSDYTYNPVEIEVKDSFAQLIGADHLDTGATTNPGCGLDLSGAWGNADWGPDANNKATENWVISGGNGGAFINVKIDGGENKTTKAGLWQQGFSTVANPDIATVSFNWKITAYSGGCLDSYYIYVFVDNFSGDPNLDNNSWVWRQAITVPTGWNTPASIDVKSKLTNDGTYYLKVAARRTTKNGNSCTNTAGFDNIQLNWSKTTIVYPSDSPTIYPTVSSAPTNIINWTNFEEIASTSDGQIFYQLATSTTNNSWQYWKSSTGKWAKAVAATDYNASSTVNTYIHNFSTSTSKVYFKAFLVSSGSQQVKVDEVKIGYLALGGSGYKTFGYLVSSAFDTKSTSSFQTVEWDQNPLCTDCSIKLYAQAAPDNNGSPGAWTNWYGYFSKPQGNMIINTINGNRWVRYRAELYGNSSETPVLTGVRINYR